MRVLGIVPARAGSKRLPGKNTRDLGGKPLVAWAIEAAMRSTLLTRLKVSSDDERVLSIAAGYSEDLPLRRPEALAGDRSPAVEYVRHALECVGGEGDGPYDAVAIVQATSPFTTCEDIDGAVGLLERTGADSAVTVVKVDHAVHPVKLKTMEGDRLLPFLEEEDGRMAAFELPELFVRNCSVYATRRRVIESGSILGRDCRGYLMPRRRSLDINEEVDFLFAEFLLERGKA
ncbi:MAG: acylneuraminate cytidylyltransferase family protein [Holophagales bacterium]|nr:MAG: acylneuraminate cytidylyltransferase family protein [Holophagales bacterium]